MTKFKKFIILGSAILVIGAISITAYAASGYENPAQALAGLTNQTEQQVTEQRQQTGKTYGELAKDAGKLTEFKAETLKIKQEILKEKVESGQLTQERADEILKAIEEKQATCDGTGAARIGRSMGAGFGMGNGNNTNKSGNGTNGSGFGSCDGSGMGGGRNGAGRGLRDGSCSG